MTIGGRYEISAAELQPGTFDGHHLILQRAIQLHVLGRNRSTNMLVLERMKRLPEQRRRMIIDAGEQEGLTYVVTWPLEGSSSLIQWLGQEKEPAGPPAASSGPYPEPSPAVSPPPPGQEPSVGEFTNMFSGRAGGRVPADPLVPNPPPPPSPLPPSQPVTGDFTQRFFGTPGGQDQKRPAASATPPAVPAQQPSPGEFTQMFGGAPAGRRSGGFPAQSASLPPPAPVIRPQPPAPASTPPAPPEPGEFTRFFYPDVAEHEEPPPIPLSKPADAFSFTQVFQRAVADPVRTVEPLPLPSPPLAPPPVSSGTLAGQPASAGTSDYTRVVGSPQLTGTPPPFAAKLSPPLPSLPKPAIAPPSLPKPPIPLPPPALPAAAPGFPLVWLVVILAALLVLAVLFVAVLVIKNR